MYDGKQSKYKIAIIKLKQLLRFLLILGLKHSVHKIKHPKQGLNQSKPEILLEGR
jgi:hypothetical protein